LKGSKDLEGKILFWTIKGKQTDDSVLRNIYLKELCARRGKGMEKKNAKKLINEKTVGTRNKQTGGKGGES